MWIKKMFELLRSHLFPFGATRALPDGIDLTSDKAKRCILILLSVTRAPYSSDGNKTLSLEYNIKSYIQYNRKYLLLYSGLFVILHTFSLTWYHCTNLLAIVKSLLK